MNTEITTRTTELARRIRAHALRMVYQASASHIGGCLSMADVLAVLYSEILRIDPQDPRATERDRFILSKGHAAAIVYAVLAEKGFFPTELLDKYCQDDSPLGGHLTHHRVPGVEFSTGSLGHGLSLGCGIALASKRANCAYRAYVMLSDGECDEGAIWEAALFAPHHRLDTLVAIVDYNKIQSFGTVKEVLDLEPFADKWLAFGWAVRQIDGHDHQQINETLKEIPFEQDRPSVVIAHTVKGGGVPFMENQLAWHYRSPDKALLDVALNHVTNQE